MRTIPVSGACSVMLTASLYAVELHVATNGNDADPGTVSSPLRSVQRASDLAQPGDTVTVHAGVYRERVNPPRGGVSDLQRITYRSAPGEQVVITGSEPVKNWVQVSNDTWTVSLPNSFFGAFNPYGDRLRGDWFNPKGREHHTGAVYLNGEWLTEAAKLDDVLKPADKTPRWFGRVDQERTVIWAQYKGLDPNRQLVEINVRPAVFYPDRPGRNYITVRGFTMRHAATPWAPPTAEQVGLIGTHWSKGWVIENNTISHSVCSGISLGKHGDRFDNTSADSAEGYVKTIERAHAYAVPWTKDNIGSHIVRSNTISQCEQAGIVGSLGCSFSTVTDNVIHDIHVRKLFTGAEMAGIKFHGAIDTEISRNRIYRTCRGLWLDWMAQGTRVSRNLFYDNDSQDLFVEVNHGPFLIDNNLFLSGTSLLDVSEGGAYAHNMIAGKIVTHPELKRDTPFHPAHATDVAGLVNTKGGDNRFYNNLFIGKPGGASGYGLSMYDNSTFPLLTGGNVYCCGARPHAKEVRPVVVANADPRITLSEDGARVFMRAELTPISRNPDASVVTTDALGLAKIPQLPYVNPDHTRMSVDTDYFGKPRNLTNPTPGPFENPSDDTVKIKVW